MNKRIVVLVTSILVARALEQIPSDHELTVLVVEDQRKLPALAVFEGQFVIPEDRFGYSATFANAQFDSDHLRQLRPNVTGQKGAALAHLARDDVEKGVFP